MAHRNNNLKEQIMTLGDKLKQLRMDKNWTQPQAAEAIGIEQSYLSKLENDKSVPSAEIFSSILNAFAVDVATFMGGLNLASLDRQFLQIPAIAARLHNHKEIRIYSMKKWLFSSAVAVALGLTLIASAHLGLLFSNKQFQYYSPGIVLEGESKNIFDNWEQNIRPKNGHFTQETRDALNLKQQEMTRRLSEDYLLVDEYQGALFSKNVAGGTRTYQLYAGFTDGKDISATKNRFLMLIGFLLTFSGLSGFFVEYRLRNFPPELLHPQQHRSNG
jgi:transcriptional regulator with XRE-family HTH domain